MDFIYALADAVAKFFAALVIAITTLFGFAPHITVAPEVPQGAATTTQEATDEPESLAPEAPSQKQAPAAKTPGDTSLQAGEESPLTQAAPTKSFSEINTEARAALVNILCTTKRGGYLHPITGSGVIVDSRGIVLTAAHVAQYFLLRDYGTPGNVDCIIRAGSPAEPRYRATLLYLPPAWVAENAPQIVKSEALGTGERDYAFLLITGTVNPNIPLPSGFPFLELDFSERVLGEQVLLASYPAGFLSGEIVATDLYASSALAYLTQLYSFEGAPGDVDLFSIGGTILSQSGSSGGAAVPLKSGKLGGIITTAILEGPTGERDLRALTLAYINGNLKAAGQGGIAGLFTGDLTAKAAAFNAQVAPGLTKLLSDVLGR